MICGAKAKSTGQPCQRHGMTTNGRCMMHGGKAGRPPTHGRYSVKHRASLAASVEEFRADPEPGNLLDELALMRALTQDVLARFPDGMPLPLEAVQAVSSFLTDTSKLVERIAKIESQRQLAASDVEYLLSAVADILNRFVPEHDRQRAIESLRAVIVARQPRSASVAIGAGGDSAD